MLESQIKKQIKAALLQKYPVAVWYKIHGGPQQERGIPDIIGCYHGRFVAMEIKRPGADYREPTPYQRKQITDIKMAGGVTGVVTSVEEALELMKKYFSR